MPLHGQSPGSAKVTERPSPCDIDFALLFDEDGATPTSRAAEGVALGVPCADDSPRDEIIM